MEFVSVQYGTVRNYVSVWLTGGTGFGVLHAAEIMERLWRCRARCCRWQVRPDQIFRLFPHIWITFDLGVLLHEDTVIPGILVAGIRVSFVVKSKIPDNLRARRIGGANCRWAVNKSIQLVEIGGLGYI